MNQKTIIKVIAIATNLLTAFFLTKTLMYPKKVKSSLEGSSTSNDSAKDEHVGI